MSAGIEAGGTPRTRPDADAVAATREEREREVLARTERARRRAPKVREDRITLAHGAGGRSSHALTEAVFLSAFTNPALAELEDQAVVEVGGARLAFTTDSFVVSPLFFPGGSIGDLAVNGTVNDLAVSGATPRFLSAGFVIEEGLEVTVLTRIVEDMRAAAAAAGVEIVTGDTKVVERGKGDGCYINTSGVGLLADGVDLGARHARPGDVVLVSGPIGEHGITILLARGDLDFESDITSDTAPLHALSAAAVDAAPGLRCMRDATRGGLATVLNEIATSAGVAVRLTEDALPIRPDVVGACEVLGIDPLYVACEGRMVLVVAPEDAQATLAALQALPGGEQATPIGSIAADPEGLVLLDTTFGGTRVVDVLVGDPLPRIC